MNLHLREQSEGNSRMVRSLLYLSAMKRLLSLLPIGFLLLSACGRDVRATPTPAPLVSGGGTTTLNASPTCDGAMFRNGHAAPSVFCTEDVDYFCANALLSAGHPPTHLMMCRNVNGACAATQIAANVSLMEIPLRCSI